MRTLRLLGLAALVVLSAGRGRRRPGRRRGRRSSRSRCCRPRTRPRSRGAGGRSSPSSRRTCACSIKHVTATDYRGTIEALKFKKAEIGHLGPEVLRGGLDQQLRQRRAGRPAPARQRLARLSLVSHRARRLRHLQPRGHRGQDLCVQRPQLDLRLPGAVLVLHDGDGDRSAEALREGDLLGLPRGLDPGRGNQKVEVASTNLPDLQQLTRENKVPRGALRVIWVSKLIPNDPSRRAQGPAAEPEAAIQESLVSMKSAESRGVQGDRRLGRRLRAGRRRQVSGHP